jgi:hypothetical protein
MVETVSIHPVVPSHCRFWVHLRVVRQRDGGGMLSDEKLDHTSRTAGGWLFRSILGTFWGGGKVTARRVEAVVSIECIHQENPKLLNTS